VTERFFLALYFGKGEGLRLGEWKNALGASQRVDAGAHLAMSFRRHADPDWVSRDGIP
jgi:hypothetical protein